MEKLLAIFDTDVLYATRLMEYFQKSDMESFEVLLFTKQDSLIDFLKYQTVDILLYGGEVFPKELPKENVKYTFWLCNDRNFTKDKQDIIYRYQAAGKIASDIVSHYTRLEDKSQKEAYEDVRFISVFPPVPGAEKLSYAWSLAKELSNKRKVLFISFELLPTAFMMREEDMAHSMSELLYYLKESRTDHNSKLKSYLNYSEKLSFLSGPSHGFDLLSLSREDIGKFMKEIKDHKDYELVVFYLGIYTEASMEIMSSSNEVCIATCDLPYEELVAKEWERQMELTGVSIRQLINHWIKLPTAEQMVGANPLPDRIYSAIRPIAAELAAELIELV